MSLPAPEPTIDPVAGMSACWGEAEIACVRTRHVDAAGNLSQHS